MELRVQTLSRCLAGTIAILFLAAIGAVGQTQQPADALTYAITGRVVDERGQALPNARVWAHASGTSRPPESAISDAYGNFKLTGLQRVPYSISASMPSYMPALRRPDSPQPSHYQVGDTVTLVLTKGGVITGKVTNSEGEPIVAVEVRVEAFRDPSGRQFERSGTVRTGSTDDRGIYRIYGLPTGTYRVVAGGPGYDYSRTGINAFESHVPTYAPSATRETAAEISVRAGEETTDVDIRYRAETGRVISGTASGPAGEGTGYHVILTTIGEGGSQNNKPTHQEPNGREFVFNGLTDGDYYLTAESHLASGEKAVSESKLINVRGVDVTGIELVTKPLGSISGRVVLEETKAVECTDKRPLLFAETTVAAWHKEQEANRDRARFVLWWQEPARADGEGKITLRNLIAGDYRFLPQFSAKDWYLRSIVFAPSGTKTPPARPVDAMKTWIRVKSGDRLTGLTITLAQGAASLTVQVETGAGQTIPEKLFLYLVPAEPEKTGDVLRFYAAPVASNGRVDLDHLAPGRYLILAQPAMDGAESLTKLQLPDAGETRARLRRAAEAAKTEIEFKPCQRVADFRLPL